MKKHITHIFVLIFCISSIVCLSQNETPNLTLETTSDNITDICFTKNGNSIGVADNNEIKVFNTTSKELIAEFKDGHKKNILSIDISMDSTLMVSAGLDSTIIIWDFINRTKIKSIKSNGIVTSARIAPNSTYLVFGGTDKTVTVYDILNLKKQKTFSEHLDDITSIKFSNNGKYFASSSADKTINIYNSNSFITKLSGHKDCVRDISFNSDGTKLISCGDDSKIIKWSLNDVKNTRIINSHKRKSNWILSIDYNIDDTTYAFGDANGNTKIISKYGSYKMRVKSPINQIFFKPNQGIYIYIALATRGKGVLLIDSKHMKTN